MTDPLDDKPTPTKGRLIVNIVLLVLNLIIAGYFFQYDRILIALLFLALAIRNAYIVYTEWQGRR